MNNLLLLSLLILLGIPSIESNFKDQSNVELVKREILKVENYVKTTNDTAKFIDTLPNIIDKASSNNLGIIALIIIAVSIIAFFFFRNANVKVRVSIFTLLFIGFSLLTIDLLREDKKKSKENTSIEINDTRKNVDAKEESKDIATKNSTEP